jgi:hypothetical protein
MTPEHAENRINSRDMKSRIQNLPRNTAFIFKSLQAPTYTKKQGLVLGYRPPVFRRSMQFALGCEFVKIVRKTLLPSWLRGTYG